MNAILPPITGLLLRVALAGLIVELIAHLNAVNAM